MSVAAPRYRWVILAIAYASVITFGLCYQGLPPLQEALREEFDVTQETLGAVTGRFTMFGMLISLPVGILATRRDLRRLSLAAYASMIIGMILCAISTSPAMLGWSRAVAGMGSSALSVTLPLTLGQWFRGRELGLVFGILNTAFPLGATVAFQCFPGLAAANGWRLPIWLSAGAVIAAAAGFLAFYRPAATDSIRSGLTVREAIRQVPGMDSRVWLLCGLWMMFNGGLISYMAHSVRYFELLTPTMEAASRWTGFAMTVPLLLSPFMGGWMGRTRTETVMLAGGAGIAAMTLLLLPHAGAAAAWWLAVAMGVGVSLVPQAVFALPAQWLAPERMAVAYGMLNTAHNFGSLCLPPLAGAELDRTGSMPRMFAVMAAGPCLALLFGLILWWRDRRGRRRAVNQV